jgi:flagellar M-ring protein FliF
MNFFQKLNAIWKNVSMVQRVLLTAIGLTFIIIVVLLTYWARRPDMGVLYSNLDREEAAMITEKISDKDIVYKLANGGTTIYAPKESIAQLRLDMAKEGLPKDGQKGYGIFDNEKIGVSPFVQNVNLKRALQDELAKSIQMIDGVSHARVHIVSSEQTVFTSGSSQTSASVVLQLRPGYKPSALNVAAITHLVAGSVEGLSSENVTLVDSQGHLLSGTSDQIMAGGAGTVADYRERVEQNLADKVESMLIAVLGPGRAKVEVSAEIDMTSSNIAKEIYDQGKKVPRKEEIKSESETEAGKASAESEATVPGSMKKGETIVTEYAVPKTVQQTVELPGEIKSLTVAAFVDLSPPEKNETTEGETEQAESEAAAEPIMTISDVEEIIKKALGPKLKDEDLKVVDARFNRPTASLIGPEKPSRFDLVAIAKHGSLGIMAICALVVLKMFGKAKKKAAEAVPAEGLPAAAGQTAGLLPAGAEGSESLMLRKQIASILRSNPEQAKKLFASWLEEKGS